MQHISKSSILFFFILWIIGLTPHAQGQEALVENLVCNQDRSICVNAKVEDSVIENPLYFEVRVRCPDAVVLHWELHDNSGELLDQDADGSMAFLVARASASERTIGVRDFSLAPAKTNHGNLALHVTALPTNGGKYLLPDLSIPLQIDMRTSEVTYAVPADPDEFLEAVDELLSPAQRPIQAKVDWRKKTVLHVNPGMIGGAAAAAAARGDQGQSPWNVINYKKAGETAHVTVIGDGWAGVSYYLTGFDYLLQKTIKHQPDVRHVVFDMHPDFAQ